MQYTILHNNDYSLCFDTATRYTMEAESINEVEERIRETASAGHFSVFCNKKEVHDFVILRIEDTEEYKNNLYQEHQDRLSRVREILKSHDIEMVIEYGSCEYCYLSFEYKKEVIFSDELYDNFTT